MLPTDAEQAVADPAALADSETIADPETIADSAGEISESRLRRAAKLVGFLLMTAVMVYFFWPVWAGGRFAMVIVAGHSMEPTYNVGDVVVTWRDGKHQVGDPVLFKIPDLGPGENSSASGAMIIHRLVGGDPSGWVTKGDNVPQPDIWSPSDEDVLGRAVAHFPGVGKAVVWVRSPLVWAALFSVIVTLYLWPYRDELEELEELEIGPLHGPPTPVELRVDGTWADWDRRRFRRFRRRSGRHSPLD